MALFLVLALVISLHFAATAVRGFVHDEPVPEPAQIITAALASPKTFCAKLLVLAHALLGLKLPCVCVRQPAFLALNELSLCLPVGRRAPPSF